MALQVSAGRMVGRDDELGRLLTLLDDAEAGRRWSPWSVATPAWASPAWSARSPGLAAGRGFTVLSGQCAELGDSVPYLPLADALRGAAAGPAGSGTRSPTRPALGRLLPEGGTARPPARTGPGWPGSRCSAACSAC